MPLSVKNLLLQRLRTVVVGYDASVLVELGQHSAAQVDEPEGVRRMGMNFLYSGLVQLLYEVNTVLDPRPPKGDGGDGGGGDAIGIDVAYDQDGPRPLQPLRRDLSGPLETVNIPHHPLTLHTSRSRVLSWRVVYTRSAMGSRFTVSSSLYLFNILKAFSLPDLSHARHR